MTDFAIVAATFLGGIFISWALTGMILKYAQSRSLIDIPNERSSHQQPTPRGGGLSIVILFITAVSASFGLELLHFKTFMALFGGAALVASIGFWDDHDHIAARWRILIHFIASIWSLYWIGGFPVFSLGEAVIDLGPFGYIFGALFLVWLLNLFNFMDGIDGIAASEAIFISLAATFLCYLNFSGPGLSIEAQLLVVLASGCIGFLRWNWPPASIFMGDVGSGFLGFILGILALITAHKGVLTIWCWLILLGTFLADATVTLIRRILRGERWYEAHRSHAYQHASRRFASHRIVTLAFALINVAWLFPLAWACIVWPSSGFTLAFVALSPLFFLAYRCSAGIV